MKRALLLTALTVLSLAQRSRDDYRAAYRTWRQTDPNLEHEAAAGGPPIAQRADRMAAEAQKSAAARKEYFEGLIKDEDQQVSWLESSTAIAEAAATSSKGDTQFIAAETASLNRTIETFSSDPDKGIQTLRAALIRERTALEALGPIIAQRKKAAEAVRASAGAIEVSRAKGLEQSLAMLDGLKDASAEIGREGDAWAEYYRKIGEGAQGVATPITAIPAGVPPAVLNNPIPAPPTITPVPLSRYVGAWTYPAKGLYHGAEPEFIDVLVHEENGHVKGTAFARFKLPAGNTGDPVLRFDFFGDFQAKRNQVFDLVTTDGAKGTIELIPGSAFNLLEVNFQTEAKPGKIRQADIVLVKK